MKVNTKIIKKMEKEFIIGIMVINMKGIKIVLKLNLIFIELVNTKIILNLDLGYFIGLTETDMKDNGKMINVMVKELISLQIMINLLGFYII